MKTALRPKPRAKRPTERRREGVPPPKSVGKRPTVRGRIPLFDLRRQDAPLLRELKAAAGRVLGSGRYILGPEVSGFEAEFARALGVPHCIGVSSGTEALRLALEALGVGPGDEVIVPAFTFIATATAVSALGAKPVFADVDPVSLTLAPGGAAARATARAKALIAVHLYGCPADMDGLLRLAKDRGLRIVEDCAQAHLAEYRGRCVGGLGDFGCFSFYPTKNLGAAGDAGAVTARDDAAADAVRVLRNVGRAPGDAYRHVRLALNSRLDELQAALLRVKLRRLKSWTAERRRAAARYRAGLAGLPLRPPPAEADGTRHAYHLFVVQTPRREALARRLLERGVETGAYYPLALPRQPAYASLGHREGEFPEAERAAREALALPLYPGLADAEIDFVCAEIRKFLLE